MNRENQLLPWRITETLNDDETRAVDQALEENPDFASERHALAGLREHLQQDAVSPGDAAACLMATKAKIARQAPSRNLRSRWWMTAGFAASLVVAAGIWQSLRVQDDLNDTYETLTSPSDYTPGTIARIVFVEGLTAEELDTVLMEWDASLVNSGDASGVFTLRFDESVDLTTIERDPRVRMVRSDDL